MCDGEKATYDPKSTISTSTNKKWNATLARIFDITVHWAVGGASTI